MGLTYVGAQAFVDAIYAELMKEFEVPACKVIGDEPPGDFGIAHAYGIDANGCARITFDNDHIPTAYVVRHEAGHALSSEIARRNGGSNWTNGVYDAWWKARGFPGTAWDMQLAAIAKEAVAINSGYRFWPEEMFADTFGVVLTPYAWPLTDHLNVWLDQPKMRAFYQSLGPPTSAGGDDLSLTQEEHDALITMSAAMKTMADTFNALAKVSLPEWLDRLGDKRDVKTGGPIDQT